MHDAGDDRSWSGLVVVCGVRRWDGKRGSAGRLAAGLAAHAPVLYVDPPASGGGTDEVPELRIVAPRLAHLTPRGLPVRTRSGPRTITGALARRSLRHAVADLGSPDVRAVIVSSFDPWFGVCDEGQRVFYAADDFLAGADLARLSDQRLQRDLGRSLDDADLLVVGSPNLAAGFRRQGYDPILLPNGCDDRAPSVGPVPATSGAAWLDRPIAGFVGDLSSQVDLAMLDAVADRGRTVLLVGRGPVTGVSASLRALVERPNVAWVGPRSRAGIGAYFDTIDVGLAPFVDTPFGRANPPLDLVGHLAAGRPVVGSDCESVRWLRAESARDRDLTDGDLALGATPDSFADLVEERLGEQPDRTAEVRRRRFARRHRWSARCDELATLLGLDDLPVGAAPGEGRAAGGDR